MAFPVSAVRQPAALAGVENGRIPGHLLTTVPSLHRGKDITLLDVASRSFLAMRSAAEKDGVRLEAISSYRTYEQQVTLFTARYSRTFHPGVPSRVWNGQRWYHVSGATTAVPGTSNHGSGLAIDFIVGTGFVNWAMANAKSFGFSWEIQSENWHLRYFSGDVIPAATRAYEQVGSAPPKPKPIPPPPIHEEADMVYIRDLAGEDDRLVTIPGGKLLAGDSKTIESTPGTPEVRLGEKQWGHLAGGSNVVRV